MNNPKITIVTVSYNAVDCIEETILSVINQDYPNLEYIVIDGGSTDGTVDIIKKYETKISYWISESDKGLYDAMNKGIVAGTGEWINFRNCGDLFVEKSSLSKLFEQDVDPDVMVLHADSYRIDGEFYYLGKPSSLSNYKKTMPLVHPATFVRLSLHKKMLFNLKYKVSADYDLIYRCIEKGYKFEYRPIVIVSFPFGGYSDVNWRTSIQNGLDIRGYNTSFIKKIYGYYIIRRQLFSLLISKIGFLNHLNQRRLNKKIVKNKMPLPFDRFY